MRFLALFHFADGAMAHLTADEMRALDDATIRHDHKLREGGNLIYAGPLKGPETARWLTDKNGKVIVTDGPFSESKEAIGGFVLGQAESLEAFLKLFEDDPILKYCRMEVREVVTDHVDSDTGQTRPEPKVG